MNRTVVVSDVSLPHSERIKQVVVQMVPSNYSRCASPTKIEQQMHDERECMSTIQILERTKTDWESFVKIIRKNHNIVDKRRTKKLKRI